MKVYRRSSGAGQAIIGLAAVFLAVVSPGRILAQSETIDKPQLTRYTVPTETWATPIIRDFQWVYYPEAFERTLPFFAYKFSTLVSGQASVCSSLGTDSYSQYDTGTVALVYEGQEYVGFPLGSGVDTKTLETLGRKVAMSRILKKRGFDIGTDFQDAKKTIDDFIVGLGASDQTNVNVVSKLDDYYDKTWIPSSPSARNLMKQMIDKAKGSEIEFATKEQLWKYWRDQATVVVDELDSETDRSTKMLEFVVNAAKTKDKTSKHTLNPLCESSNLIVSRREALGDSLLLATKRPLPNVVPDTRLTGAQPLGVMKTDQDEASGIVDAQGKN